MLQGYFDFNFMASRTKRLSGSKSARNFVNLKWGLKAKTMGLSKVTPITLDLISVDSIVFDPAILEIFYFKHDVGDFNVLNFNNFYWQPCR